MYLPNARRINGESSGSYTGGPYRIVLHTTEGSSIDGAVGAYRAARSWPHFTINPRTKDVVQHLDTSVAARALKNASGGVDTNRRSAIQVEIVGKAAEGFTAEHMEWLGRVLSPLFAAHRITTSARNFIGNAAYGTNSPSRMSFVEWNSFNGICGHQHVPENAHWDPGRIDIAAFIKGVGGMAPPAQELRTITIDQGNGKVRVDKQISTDSSGNGWDVIQRPFSQFRAATVHGSYPKVDGYWNAPIAAVQDRGGETVVVVTEGPPNSVVTVFVAFEV